MYVHVLILPLYVLSICEPLVSVFRVLGIASEAPEALLALPFLSSFFMYEVIRELLFYIHDSYALLYQRLLFLAFWKEFPSSKFALDNLRMRLWQVRNWIVNTHTPPIYAELFPALGLKKRAWSAASARVSHARTKVAGGVLAFF